VRAVPVSDLEWDDAEPTEQDVTLVVSLGTEVAKSARKSSNDAVGKANGKKIEILDEPTAIPTGSSPGRSAGLNGAAHDYAMPRPEIEDAATAIHQPNELDALLRASQKSQVDLGATVVRGDLAPPRGRDPLGETVVREDLVAVAVREERAAASSREPAAKPRPNIPPPIDSDSGEEIVTVSLSEVQLEDPTAPYPVGGARANAPAPSAASSPLAAARAPLPAPQPPPAGLGAPATPLGPPAPLPPPAMPPASALPPPASPPSRLPAPPSRAPLAPPVAPPQPPPQPMARPTGNRSRWARMGTLQGGIMAPGAAGGPPAEVPPLAPPAAPAAATPALRQPTLQGLPRNAPPVAPPGASRTEATAPRAVDMTDLGGEEDEDEATLIFAKPGSPSSPAPPGPGSAPRLPAPIPAAGMPAPVLRTPTPPPVSAAPPPPPVPPMPSVAPAPTPAPPPALLEAQRAMQASLPPVTPKTNRMGAVLGGIAFVVSATLAVFLLLPRKGRLVVEIAPDNNAPVSQSEVFVDGRKVCERAPCVVSELSPGPKSVRVIAQGFVTPDIVIETVEAGRESHVKIPLRAMAPARGGLRAAGNQPGVKLFVDGNERGALPASLDDLGPGTHALRFDGGDRYQTLERTVDVVGGQVKDLGDVRLKVKKGKASITLATKGADVRLFRKDKGEKSGRTLDGPWPVNVDVDVAEGWRLTATKKNLEPFAKDLTFDDGNPEATIRIELQKPGAEPPPPPPEPKAEPKATEPAAPGPKPEPKAAEPKATPAPPPEPKAPEPKPEPKAAAPSGSGTLNVNSLPLSSVLIDGRPYGSTPKTDISLPAGSHTVTFVHPDLGRKSVTVNIEPGKAATAAVRFKKPDE
jgi:serine/threonine-protein kinase